MSVRHLLAGADDAPWDPGKREAAQREIEAMGDPALPELTEILLLDGRHSRAAALSLAGLGDSGIPALEEALASDVPRVRALAADGLARNGSDPAIEAVVKELLSGADRVGAATALGLLPAPHPQAVAALREAAGRSEKDVAAAANASLRSLGVDASPAAEGGV